jgi:signal peptidase I
VCRRSPRARAIVDWVVTIAAAVAVVLALKAEVANPYRIPSPSMEPTLHCAAPSAGCTGKFSDRVLAVRFLYHLVEPERGDIVVFEAPPATARACASGGAYVKRLVGLPGETVEERRGVLYVDGRRLVESYVLPANRGEASGGPWRVPAGEYFLAGDNRRLSCDSRRWGTVPRDRLIGPVEAVYWPPGRVGSR